MIPLVLILAAGALVVLVVGLVAVLIRTQSSREARLSAAHLAAQRQIEALTTQVAGLAQALETNRSQTAALRAAERNHEYVITSLTSLTGESVPDTAVRPPLGETVQQQVAEVAARLQGSRGKAALGEFLVQGVAWGHGVRRALSPEVRDRAAAAAHIERRRSRRQRRQEIKDARRLLRAVRSQQNAQQRAQDAA